MCFRSRKAQIIGHQSATIEASESSGGLDCGLGCDNGLRRLRWGCFGGSSSRNVNVGISPLNQPPTRHQFAWPASMTLNMPHIGVLYILPKSNCFPIVSGEKS